MERRKTSVWLSFDEFSAEATFRLFGKLRDSFMRDPLRRRRSAAAFLPPSLFLSCLGINKGSKRIAVCSTKRMQALDTEFPGSFLNIPREWILSCFVPAWKLELRKAL